MPSIAPRSYLETLTTRCLEFGSTPLADIVAERRACTSMVYLFTGNLATFYVATLVLHARIMAGLHATVQRFTDAFPTLSATNPSLVRDLLAFYSLAVSTERARFLRQIHSFTSQAGYYKRHLGIAEREIAYLKAPRNRFTPLLLNSNTTLPLESSPTGSLSASTPDSSFSLISNASSSSHGLFSSASSSDPSSSGSDMEVEVDASVGNTGSRLALPTAPTTGGPITTLVASNTAAVPSLPVSAVVDTTSSPAATPSAAGPLPAPTVVASVSDDSLSDAPVQVADAVVAAFNSIDASGRSSNTGLAASIHAPSSTASAANKAAADTAGPAAASPAGPKTIRKPRIIIPARKARTEAAKANKSEGNTVPKPAL
uniref:Uncharacterized protein n=1 Tax=Mycena chlorophos TaxID=658473 RepID=A0ABQ0KTY7_MYCCL|nr:predicted protein [Mycena chlorophos]